MGTDYLTPEEAAVHLNVNPRTVREWCRSGTLPSKKVGRLWRIEAQALVKHMASDCTRIDEPNNPQVCQGCGTICSSTHRFCIKCGCGLTPEATEESVRRLLVEMMTKDLIQEIKCNIERRLKDMMIQEPEKYEELAQPVRDAMKKFAAK